MMKLKILKKNAHPCCSVLERLIQRVEHFRLTQIGLFLGTLHKKVLTDKHFLFFHFFF